MPQVFEVGVRESSCFLPYRKISLMPLAVLEQNVELQEQCVFMFLRILVVKLVELPEIFKMLSPRIILIKSESIILRFNLFYT